MSVATGVRQATFCATLVDELALGGVRHAVICPGSRSTPLALAVANSSLTIHVRLDERSAGFYALGLARATSTPVLVVVTSGTAAAELHAAVVEAHLDRVPLIVATADRPPELRDVGAPQTIDQVGLFGAHVAYASLPGPCHAWPEELWRPLASRMVLEAMSIDGRPGPVHVNLPFVDPLDAEPSELPPPRAPGTAFYDAVESIETKLDIPKLGARGVVVAGEGCGPSESVDRVAQALGWPVLADPRSNCRALDGAISSADSILRSEDVAHALRPEAIVLVGAPHASKVLTEWIAASARAGSHVVVVGHDGPARHPTQVAATFLVGDPSAILDQLAASAASASEAWLATWKQLDAAAQGAIDSVLSDGALCEPSVARALSSLSDGAIVVSSSSMPIRDFEWFSQPRPAWIEFMANRGANGIDGVVSTAMGVAASGEAPVIGVVGDLAFLHDVSAFVDGIETGSLTLVVLDNGGGGIFSFLPQKASVGDERFEQLFGTPKDHSIAAIAQGFGIDALEVSTHDALAAAVDARRGSPGLSVIVAKVPDRSANVERHRQLNEAVATAIASIAVR
jgi:2-succinyl-5-enolpyruvyl-6-hydroxy-3-cyclohexene-1-carboxylate synthase